MTAIITPSSSEKDPGALLKRSGRSDGNRDCADHDHVQALQRSRILSAMVELAARDGLAGSSVARVVKRSGVSRRTFYEIFEDREACFLAAFEQATARAGEYVIAAYESGGPTWRARVRAGLIAMLSLLDREPALGRLLVVESLGSGRLGLSRRAALQDTLVGVIEEGGEQPKARRDLPDLTGEGIVGAVVSVIHTRMISDDPSPMITLTNQIMAMIVLPYLGAATATRELNQPIPPPPLPPAPQNTQNPLQTTGMRLTYRTIRVLLAIGEQPQASNREIAKHAGITDQGQTSKLLLRLQKHNLITNTGQGHTHGSSNAWTLTPQGHQIEQIIKGQTKSIEAVDARRI